jgi:hypothetical protein
MLPNTLNTNEIKNNAGTGTSFTRRSISESATEFNYTTEAPNKPVRMDIKHTETGVGLNKRRRSLIRFDYSHLSSVDATLIVKDSLYVVLDTSVGHHVDNTHPTILLAYMNSFMASLGASTTILYDGTGNGARVLMNAEL